MGPECKLAVTFGEQVVLSNQMRLMGRNTLLFLCLTLLHLLLMLGIAAAILKPKAEALWMC